MYRRVSLTVFWLALYFIAALALSLLPWLCFWQCLILLLPVAGSLVGLVWTKPFPDFSIVENIDFSPIEDLSNPSRDIMWLNGTWEFRISGGKRWHRLEVPRPWNTIKGLERYEGKAYYRRLIKLPDDWDQGKLFLRCRGANYRTVVSIDGKQVGTHEGGYTPFEFEVTDRLSASKEFELELTLDNSLTQSSVPNVVGWNNDGGILREIYIENRRQIHIQDVYILTIPDMKGRSEVALITKIYNPGLEPRDYKIEIFSPQGAIIHEQVVEGWTMQTLQHRFQINFVSLWSPDNPALYKCRVSVIEENGDELGFSFGIRSLEIEPDGVFLNGEKIKIRGITRTEESPLTGTTQSLASIKSDLEEIKAAGFNTVLLGNFPPHSKTIELCDKMGLLAIEQIPVWNSLAIDISDPAYQQAAEAQLRDIIQRDRNRPSIIAWGIANDIESNTNEARWFIERLTGLARGLDDRPVFITTSNPAGEMCADLVDFVSVSCNTRKIDEIEKQVKATEKLETPLIIMHHGAPADKKPGSKYAGVPGTLEYQALFIQEFIDSFDNYPSSCGWIISSFSDYRDPSNFAGATPFIRKHGLTTQNREKKLAFESTSKWLKTGQHKEIPIKRKKMPVTTLSKIFAIAWLATAALLFAVRPGLVSKLFYDPPGFVEGFHYTWSVILFIALFSGLSWAVLVNRFLTTAPRMLFGSIDTPFLIMLSRVIRAEWSFLLTSYLTLIWMWIANTTFLTFFMPQDYSLVTLLCLTSAMCLPDVLMIFTAMLRIPLLASFLAYLLWKSYLCYISIGLTGTIVYVFAGPIAIILASFAFIEYKFHILKYIRKMV
ncbi:MAG TPA: glycoside hydrolase family 2 TIM barrel-domain containing protein [bacterium]|nr:glycoside hydrolase family 2 TIM barrel-domain containing protein [bacterium]